jgi:hypothetical protein
MKTLIDQHHRCELDNIKIESFQSADALRKLFSELDFRLGDDSWIEDDSYVIGTLYYRDIVRCFQFLLARLTFQAHLDVETVHHTDFVGCQI